MSASEPKTQREALDAVAAAERDVEAQHAVIEELANVGVDTGPARLWLEELKRVVEARKREAQRLTMQRVLR